jgi:hypothetical protein
MMAVGAGFYSVLEGGMTGQRDYCGWKKIRTGME